jgi:hypothetical protein
MESGRGEARGNPDHALARGEWGRIKNLRKKIRRKRKNLVDFPSPSDMLGLLEMEKSQ